MFKQKMFSIPFLAGLIFIGGCQSVQKPKSILKVLPSSTILSDPSKEFHSLKDAIAVSRSIDNCEIQVEAGRYFLDETLVLDSLDNHLILTSKSAKKPVIYGGIQLKNIVQEGKFWVAKAGKLDFRVLEVNGRFAERSRLPETGTFHHLSTFNSEWLSTFNGGFSPKPNVRQLQTMKYKPEDLELIEDLDNSEVTLYHSWDETLVRVASNDKVNHELTFTQEPAYPAGAFKINRYVVWNTKEGITKPGQWYLDRKAGKVYYLPRENETLETSTFVVPTLDKLIQINHASNIEISNIEFRSNNSPLIVGGFGAKWFDGAINFENSKNLIFNNLSFCNLTTHALKGVKCHNVTISNCNIHDIGGIGIRFIGSDSKITNNLIHDVGLVYPSTIALYVNVTDPNAKAEWQMGKEEGNILIDHNEIYNAPYVGICSGGHDTHITNNRVSKVVQVLTDGGGIYVTFCKNLVLKGNFVSDIVNQEGAGTSAYYLDEFTNNATVEGNLSINVHRPVHSHFCDNNTFRNNIFIVEHGNGRITLPRCKDFIFENNIFLVETNLDIFGLNVIRKSFSNILYSSANGSVTGSDVSKYQAVNQQKIEDMESFYLTDPNILEYANGLVRFAKGSSAIKLGIQPIDVSGAGSDLNN